jgi:hypothetical protein
MEHHDDGAVLVHGTVESEDAPGWRIDHAWVELPGGVVFDGVFQRFYDRASYYAARGVRCRLRMDALASPEPDRGLLEYMKAQVEAAKAPEPEHPMSYAEQADEWKARHGGESSTGAAEAAPFLCSGRLHRPRNHHVPRSYIPPPAFAPLPTLWCQP